MNNRIMTLLEVAAVTCLLALPVGAEVSVIRSPYQPNRVYAGSNPATSIYYRNPGNPQWRRAFQRELPGLSCRPALSSFAATGTWMGHINPDGTCADPAEPVEWATGNRLNYEGVVGKTGR